MIRVNGLTKQFGNIRVLDEISFAAESGERLAILGLNGAGKTTLMRCLLGLTKFDGQLEIAGCNVGSRGSEARSQVGYVPQRAPHFDGSLTELVEFFGQLRRLDGGHVRQQLDHLGLSLDEHGEKETRELSGGMLQKVLLALALGAHVPVLLLDEPTANLDARSRQDFLRALNQASNDTSILLATHRLTDVEAVADRLLVLHNGRIVFDGKMDELWQTAGAGVTLWVRVPHERRDHACDILHRQWHTSTVRTNGSSLGIQVDRDSRPNVLLLLQQNEITVEDFWTEAPSLNDLMERLIRSQVDTDTTDGGGEYAAGT